MVGYIIASLCVLAGIAVLVHDWIWARRGRGVVVSWLLLKRLNLVARGDALAPLVQSTGS